MFIEIDNNIINFNKVKKIYIYLKTIYINFGKKEEEIIIEYDDNDKLFEDFNKLKEILKTITI